MNKKRILRFGSDFHLEMFSDKAIERLKDLINFERDEDTRYFLALIGDIGSVSTLDLLFQKVSPVYERVFYVAGNHEYYNKDLKDKKTIDEIAIQIKSKCESYPNIVFLNNNIFELDEYRIIGSTFWSHVRENDSLRVMMCINDYKRIFIRDQSDSSNNNNENKARDLSSDDTNRLHQQALRFISGALEFTPQNSKNIILTHHAPLENDQKKAQYTSHPRFNGSIYNQAFCSDQTDLIIKYQKSITAWIYGHTHYNSDIYIKDVLITSNQLGYLTEDTAFNPLKFIELK